MIEKIHITNYKSIFDLKLNDLKYINIILGDNGIGKTSVLESIMLITTCDINQNIIRHIFYNNMYDIESIIKDDTIITIHTDKSIHIINVNENIKYNNEYIITYNKYKSFYLYSIDYQLHEIKDILTRSINKNKDKLIRDIKNIIKFDINDIEINDSIYFIYNSNKIPIETIGKGYIKLITLLSLNILGYNLILIDNIDHHIHYSKYNTLLDIMYNDIYSKQYFITTHNYEFIEKLYLYVSNKDYNIKNTFNIIRIEKDYKTNKHITISINEFNELKYLIEDYWEIR